MVITKQDIKAFFSEKMKTIVFNSKEDEPKKLDEDGQEDDQACGICLCQFQNNENLKALPCNQKQISSNSKD